LAGRGSRGTRHRPTTWRRQAPRDGGRRAAPAQTAGGLAAVGPVGRPAGRAAGQRRLGRPRAAHKPGGPLGRWRYLDWPLSVNRRSAAHLGAHPSTRPEAAGSFAPAAALPPGVRGENGGSGERPFRPRSREAAHADSTRGRLRGPKPMGGCAPHARRFFLSDAQGGAMTRPPARPTIPTPESRAHLRRTNRRALRLVTSEKRSAPSGRGEGTIRWTRKRRDSGPDAEELGDRDSVLWSAKVRGAGDRKPTRIYLKVGPTRTAVVACRGRTRRGKPRAPVGGRALRAAPAWWSEPVRGHRWIVVTGPVPDATAIQIRPGRLDDREISQPVRDTNPHGAGRGPVRRMQQ